MDRNKLLIGAYYFDKCNWDDFHVKCLSDANIDFLVAVSADAELLDLMKKYGIGVIATSNFELWWGGTGETGGTYCEKMPLELVDSIAASYKRHEALWGDYPVDEPNSKDFVHIGKVLNRYHEKLPGLLPFINLHPWYHDELCTAWLGNPYREYVQLYLEHIPNDYIALDIYPYSNLEVYTPNYLYGLEIISEACRVSNRDMWVIIQSGAWKKEDLLSEFQIRLQCMVALAFGARVIMHASWSPGWWEESTSCVDKQGQTNITQNYVRNVNEELKALGDTYMQYRSKGVFPIENASGSDSKMNAQLAELSRLNRELYKRSTPEEVTNVSSTNAALLCGYFENEKEEKALMIVNMRDIFDENAEADVKINYKGKIDLWINGKLTYENKESETFIFNLPSGSGAFVILK